MTEVAQVEGMEVADPVKVAIADYVTRRQREKPSEASVAAVKQHLLDALGCALGGSRGKPSEIAGSVARTVQGRPGSRVYVSGVETSIDMAAFTNSVMVRYLDYNDTFPGGGGHPSDMIPPVLAVADAYHLPGTTTIVAIETAYEIVRSFTGSVSLRGRGWDQGLGVAVAVAGAVCGMLGGDRDQVGNAVSLAAIPNVPLRQTRVGQLSMWKGCATAAGARAGVFAAQLAMAGMTGPGEPFSGEDGVMARVTGPFEFVLPTKSRSAVADTNIKFRPTEYQSQAPLEVTEQIREEVSVADIQRIQVETYWVAYSEIGYGEAKWRPSTRETADHSLPYMMASTLLRGRVRIEDFEPSRIADPEVRALMDKISIAERDDFTAKWPDQILTRIHVTLANGETVEHLTGYPKGHIRNPMTDEEVAAKFRSLAGRVGSADWAERVLTTVGGLEDLKDTAALVDLMAHPE